MPKVDKKLDDAVIKRLPVPPKGNVLHYDPELKGFAARVTYKGARAFVLVYRFKGEERRDTIGDFPAWGAKAARSVAEDWRRDARKGIDPRPEPEPEPAEDATFKARVEAFLEHGRTKRGRLLRPATKREYRRALMVYAKPLHDRPLAEIRRGEAAEVIRKTAGKRGDVTGMRTRAALSRLYTWAIANGYAETNPVTGTEGYDTPKRKRVLDDAELRLLWQATAERDDFNLIVRLILWTGTRRQEPGSMADSELTGGVWTIPDTRTKNHRPLALPLPRQAVAALEAWPRIEDRDLLFGRGKNGFQGWSDAKEELDKRIAQLRAEERLGHELEDGEEPAEQDALPAWILHDVRRTIETRLAGLGVRDEVIHRTLNHAQGPIDESYNQHRYLDEKRKALQAWADTLERIVGEAPSNVRPMCRSAS
jgi:integrase